MKKLLATSLLGLISLGTASAQDINNQEFIQLGQQMCQKLSKPVYYAYRYQKEGKTKAECISAFDKALEEQDISGNKLANDMRKVFVKTTDIASMTDKNKLTEEYMHDQERIAYSHCFDGFINGANEAR